MLLLHRVSRVSAFGRSVAAFITASPASLRQQQPDRYGGAMTGASSTSSSTSLSRSSSSSSRPARPHSPRFASSSSSSPPPNPALEDMCADVVILPILPSSENFAYLLVDRESGKVACVDPADSDKVAAAVKERDWGKQLQALLCTHKHLDHAGGNVGMKKMFPAMDVVSSAYESDMPALTIPLKHEEEYQLGSLTIKALYTPCHTRGHILFYVTSSKGGAPILFSGDTLFVGGCGRFFEGDASEMRHALMDVVAKLPADTRIFCGHEYTKSNLQFALAVEPDNEALLDKVDWVDRTLGTGGYTVPSTIAGELTFNPFMRVGQASVQAAVAGGSTDEDEVMAQLREKKNNFRPPPSNAGRFPKL